MLAQLANLRLCALMSFRPNVPVPLCPAPRLYVLRPFVCALMSVSLRTVLSSARETLFFDWLKVI